MTLQEDFIELYKDAYSKEYCDEVISFFNKPGGGYHVWNSEITNVKE